MVLLQLGGPKTLDDIEPFLAALLSDPSVIQLPLLMKPFQGTLGKTIARRRVDLVRPRYEQIGGGNGLASPILRHTQSQARSLAAKLGVPVHVAMRCSPPRAVTVVEELKAQGARRLLLIPMYPHWAASTTGSALEDFARACKDQSYNAEIHYIRAWGTHPAYIELLAQTCLESTPDPKSTHLLLSPHSLPEKYIVRGDPYRREVEDTQRLLQERLGDQFASIRLGFQSAVGPVKWIGPTTDEQLQAIIAAGTKSVALCPLGFVSDHIETLYDLDILYRKQAEDHGVKVHRVKAFNDDPRFIELLAGLAQGPTQLLETSAWKR
ncbi:MAG: ferrochelatase [Thermoplasmatota archaeon]